MSRESFLRAICEQPDDNVVRLVFADWLDENGESERAAFIRWHLNYRLTSFRPFDTGPNLEWHPPLPRHSRREGADRVEYLDGDGVVMTLIYSRGFVSRIELPFAAFMEHAKSLFSDHPITSVVLTDKQPDGFGPGFWWYDATPGDGAEYIDQPDYLPPELTGPLAHEFPTLDLAASWLSERCIDYGRWLAGLPKYSNSGIVPERVV